MANVNISYISPIIHISFFAPSKANMKTRIME